MRWEAMLSTSFKANSSFLSFWILSSWSLILVRNWRTDIFLFKASRRSFGVYFADQHPLFLAYMASLIAPFVSFLKVSVVRSSIHVNCREVVTCCVCYFWNWRIEIRNHFFQTLRWFLICQAIGNQVPNSIKEPVLEHCIIFVFVGEENVNFRPSINQDLKPVRRWFTDVLPYERGKRNRLPKTEILPLNN